MAHTVIRELNAFGQSIWLDYISRSLITTDRLRSLIEKGLRGMTSNPTIFDQAISSSNDYDESIASLTRSGKSIFEIYDDLTVADVQAAADMFAAVYRDSQGLDGYVSLEVNPQLAAREQETIAEARRLAAKVNRPNVMFKIPATEQGICAVEALVGEGMNINVTLIFSLGQYRHAAHAYKKGVRHFIEKGGSPEQIRSVASVFVSRIDTVVDAFLDEALKRVKEASQKSFIEKLKGTAAVANSKDIYREYTEIFSSDDFVQLRKKGANAQRVLWASTSTKNPAYSDIKYVTELIEKDTVNTVPDKTLDAFLDHGVVAGTFRADHSRESVSIGFNALGIDIDAVCVQLLKEGVAAFEKSFASLLGTIEKKKNIFCLTR